MKTVTSPFDNDQKRTVLQALLQEGLAGLEEAVELTPELLASIKAQGRERLSRKGKGTPDGSPGVP